MAMFLELFLGILTAMGGFVEIGELTFMLNAGSKFDYSLLWVVALGTVGIMVYGEIAGRIAAVRGQGVFNVIRERAGIRLGMLTLVSATLVCLLTTAAEIGAIALVWNLLSGWPYRPLLLLAFAFLALVIWFLRFQTLERVFGLLGLMMAVFLVVAWKMHPDWSAVAQGLVPRMPASLPSDQKLLYAYYAVSLLSSVMLPYETYFYASGVVEDHWSPRYIPLNRAIVLVGFTLGGALAASLLIIGKLYFGPLQVEPALPGTAALGAASVLGRAGLWLAIGGMFFAFAGAGIETAMSSAYNIAQFFGWTWGKYRTARDAPRFALSWLIVLALATLVVLTGVDPIKVVEYSIVFSVVILPLTYFPLMAISRDPDTMGIHRNGWLSNTLGWLYFVIVCIAAVAAIPLLVLTHGGQG
ncbi:NRAMP family divalent metal transporter [Cognatilysobacter segetis]|uniref:NRAMP family divalent metal transporter n=2 Tax=Cognatilysobacter segetis TaxID=2492394 RepID=UPI0010623775|nr:divalent metal cation transporter [Lysobacter segetis]